MSTATATGLTSGLAARACAVRHEDLPADVRELACQAAIDWYAVALAGSREPGPSALLEILPPADARETQAAGVVGHGVRLATRDAALVNGTASHVLDFDDVNLLGPCHVTAAVMPAVLALGEQRDAGGTQLIEAFVAGYETACRLAVALGPVPYERGLHPTGTVGVFGAAAGCARLLGLDAHATSRAFGIAASQAAGLKLNFGTMTKSLHAGRAAEGGLLAAELAARGFTAAPNALEADRGFAALAGGSCDTSAALAEPREGFNLRGNLFKHHAACYFAHSAIEGARELAASRPLGGPEPRRVVLHVSENELGACAIPDPETGLEVKFSIAHLAAMALLGRDTAVIEDAAANDREVVALRERVELVADREPGAPTRVEIELADGSEAAAERDVNVPERDLARQRERLEAKFRALAEPLLGPARAARLLTLLGQPEFAGARGLAAAAVA